MTLFSCPDEIRLVRYANQQLSRTEEDRVIYHLVDCESCRDLITLHIRISREADPPPPPEREVKYLAGKVLRHIEGDDPTDRNQ